MKLSVVVPLYNEELGVSHFLQSLKDALTQYESKMHIEIIIVNDGSSDETSQKVLQFGWSKIKLIELVSNSGHMGALEAGLTFATGDLIVTMDGDQQHPPKYIQRMLEIQESTQCDVVIGIRTRGVEESYTRRKISNAFYRVLSLVSDFDVQNNGGEFRLMTRQVVEELVNLSETQKVYRFLISQLGFKAEVFDFQTPPRPYGESKYSIRQLWKLGISSFIGFSTAPLTLIFLGGLFVFTLSVFYLIFLLVFYFIGNPFPGWTSLTILIVGMSSIQIMAIGVIGRYISQLLIETRRRPRFIVRKVVTTKAIENDDKTTKN